MSRSELLPELADLPTPAERPEFEQEVALICRACGHQAAYRVGRICFDPYEFAPSQPLEDAVAFSGLFRCRRCDGPGPWEFPPETRTHMTLLSMAVMADPENAPIQLGKLQLFDGTVVRTGAASEDYLKRKLEEQPDDAFLWGRLANIYDNEGDTERATPAYEKAVELDPSELEPNFTLGCYRMNGGDVAGAAECFQRVARHARTAPRRNPKLLERMVRGSLTILFDLHQQSGGAIPFPPEFDAPPAEPQEKPVVLSMVDMDLASDEAWEMLTSICLTGKVPEHIRKREASRLEGTSATRRDTGHATVRRKQRVGRNAPCPCGSGKKYKRCCG